MSGPAQVKPKFTPHKELQEGWTYISIPEDNVIIGVKISVTKVMKLFDVNDRPVKDATGNFVYSFQSSNIVKLLNKEEYELVKGQGGE